MHTWMNRAGFICRECVNEIKYEAEEMKRMKKMQKPGWRKSMMAMVIAMCFLAFASVAAASSEDTGTVISDEPVSIRIVTQESGNAGRQLSGAVFALYEADGTPVMNNNGEQVTVTTDSDGVSVLSGERAADGWAFEMGKAYYLEQIQVPEGYLFLDYPVRFAFGEKTDAGSFIYASGDTLTVEEEKGIVLRARKWVMDSEGNLYKPESGNYSFMVRPGTVWVEDENGTEHAEPDAFAQEVLEGAGKNAAVAYVNQSGEAVFNLPVTFQDGPQRYEAHFEICEEIPEDAVNNVLNGIRYDDTIHAVTVSIVHSENNYFMTVDYEDSEEEDAAVFVNKEDVVEEISAAVEASVVSGRGELKGEEFSFQLKNRDGRVMQTRMNEADGRILFDPMVFDEPGTYTYYIDQVPFEADNLVYDAHRETVTVEVSADQATRKLRARVRYDENGAVFTNASGAAVTLKNTLSGNAVREIGDMAFAFDLSLKNNGEPVNGEFEIERVGSTEKVSFEDGSASVTVKGGQTLKLKLPVGYVLAIRARDYSLEGFATGIIRSGETVRELSSELTVERGAGVEFVQTRNSYGNVSVELKNQGNAVETDRLFRFTAVFSTDASADGTVFTAKTGNSETSLVFAGGRASETFELRGGDRRVYTGIPAGTVYEIREDNYSELGYQTVVAGNDGAVVTGTVEGNAYEASAAVLSGSNTVLFTNTRDAFGELRIANTVAGNMGETGKEFHFVLEANVPDGEYGDVTFANGKASFILNDRESVVIPQLPSGTVYTVSEAEANQDGYVTTFQLVRGDTQENAEAVNSFTRTVDTDTSNTVNIVNQKSGYGGLVIEARTAGNDPDVRSWFAFRVTLTGEGADQVSGKYGDVHFSNGVSAAQANPDDVDYLNGTVPEGFFKVSVENPVVITGLPAGLRYSVETADCWSVYDKAESTSSNAGGLIRPLVVNCAEEEAKTSVTRSMIEGDSYTFDGARHTNRAEFVFTRNRTGALEIRMQALGLDAEPETAFHVRVTMKDGEGNPLHYLDATSGIEFRDGQAWQDGQAYIALRTGQSVVIRGLPFGATFEVNEDDYTSEGFQAPVYRLEYREKQDGVEEKVSVTRDGVHSGTIAADQRIVTIANRTDLGSLKIAKRVLVNGMPTDGTDADGVYTFILERKNEQDAFETVREPVTLEIRDGQPAMVQVDRLLPGTYRIREDVSNNHEDIKLVGNDEGYLIVEVAGNNAESVPTAEFISNRSIQGSLSLTKTVAGGVPESLKDNLYTFKVRLTSDAGSISGSYDTEGVDRIGSVVFADGISADISLKAGETLIIRGLPAGVSYVVEETPIPNTETVWAGDKNSGVISNTQGESVVCESRTYGNVKVLLTLDGNDTETEHAFRLRLSLADAEGSPLSGLFGTTAFVDGSYEFDLRSGESRVFTGLPNGTHYTVQAVQSNASGLYMSIPAEGMIEGSLSADPVPQLAEVVNSRSSFGGIVITNTFAGNDMEQFADSAFRMNATFTGPLNLAGQTVGGLTFSESGSRASASVQFQLKKDEKQVFLGLPHGISYVVTETEPGEGISTILVNAAGFIEGIAEEAGKVTEKMVSESNRVTVTNMRNGLGTLELLVNSEGNAAAADDSFTFEVQLDLTNAEEGFTAGTYGDMTFDAGGKAVVQMRAGEMKYASGLPAGTAYRISQTFTNGYITDKDRAEGVIEKEAVSRAVFTNTRNRYGALTIEKKTDGDEEDTNTWFEFRVRVYTAQGAVNEEINGVYGDIRFEKGVSVSRINETVPVSSSDRRHEGWFTVARTGGNTETGLARITGLPVGSRYAVEEFDYSDFYQETDRIHADGSIEAIEALDNLKPDKAAAYSGTLNVPESNQVIFTNIRNVNGTLRIVKAYNVGEGEDGSRGYIFRVTLADENGKPLTGRISDVKFDERGQASIELKAGSSRTFKGLTKGTKFTVEEVLDTEKEGFEDPRYELEYMKDGVAVKSSTNQGIIDSSNMRTLTVRNRTRRGSIKLTQSVKVNDTETETTLADGNYSFVVSGENDYEKKISITIKDGKAASATLDNLVPGVYTVKQTNAPDRMVEVRGEDATDTVTVEAGKTAEKETVNNLIYAGNLRVGLIVTGTADKTREFEFEVCIKNADGIPVSGEFFTDREGEPAVFGEDGKTSVILKAGETLVIRNLPAGYRYEIQETEPDDEEKGYTCPEPRSGWILNGETSSEIFENVYRAGGRYTVTGILEFEGGNKILKKGEFQFILSRKITDNKAEAVDVAWNEEDGTFAFQELAFTAEDLLKDENGLYTDTVLIYTVRQTKGEDASISYDTAEFVVELTLRDDGKGGVEVTPHIRSNQGSTTETAAAEGARRLLKAAPKTDEQTVIRFSNTYTPQGSFRPEVIKTLLGRPMNEKDAFSVELLDADGKLLQTAVADWHTGKVIFNDISYTLEDLDVEEGEHVKTEKTYTIREKAGSDDDILYDSRTYRMTVALEDNGEGAVSITPAFEVIGKDGKAAEAEKIEFVNRAKKELRITKELSSFSGTDTAFTFTVTLADVENTGMTGTFPVRVVREKTGAEDEVIREEVLEIREARLGGSIRLKAGETAVIGKLPYGTTYEIMERDAAGYVRDGQKGDRGTVTADENRAVFTNKTDTDSLTLQKLIYVGDKVLDENEHKKAAQQSFLFTVELTGLADMSEDRPMAAVFLNSEGKKVYEEQIIFHADKTGSRLTAEGIALSHKEKVEITGIPVGATYKITEAVPVDAKGDPIQAYTSVLSSLEGVIVKTNASGQKNEVVWKNQYVSRGRLQLSAEKLVNSRVPKQDGEYTFVLENHPDKRFENTKKVHLEATDKEGKVLFGALDYTLADDGQRYGYRIFEKAGDRSDMVYDPQVFTVEVYVEDDGCGNMITRVTRLDEEENEADIIFRNTEVDKLIFTKKIEGGRADDIFYFDVKLSQNGKELEEAVTVTLSGKDGKEISTGKYRSGQTIEVKADQTVMLSGVPTGTEYVITEDRDGRYTTKVDGKASRAVSGTVGSGKADHVFVNTQVNTKFSVSKVWADGTNGPISLVMYANDEIMDPQPEVTRSGNTYTVENLPRYDRDGNVVTYSAKEKRVSGYVAGYSNVGDYAGRNRAAYDGGTITNSQATSMTVRKVWSGLREGEKAPEIELTLLVNGDVYYTGKRTPDANGYYHWYNLPLTWNGQKAVYTVVETEIPGFVVRYENYGNVSNVTSCAYDGGTITNTAIPKTGDTQPIALWIILAVLSLAGLTGIMVTSRRRT